MCHGKFWGRASSKVWGAGPEPGPGRTIAVAAGADPWPWALRVTALDLTSTQIVICGSRGRKQVFSGMRPAAARFSPPLDQFVPWRCLQQEFERRKYFQVIAAPRQARHRLGAVNLLHCASTYTNAGICHKSAESSTPWPAYVK